MVPEIKLSSCNLLSQLPQFYMVTRVAISSKKRIALGLFKLNKCRYYINQTCAGRAN